MGTAFQSLTRLGIIAACLALAACDSGSSSNPPSTENPTDNTPSSNNPDQQEPTDTPSDAASIPAAGGVEAPSNPALSPHASDLRKQLNAYNQDGYLRLDLPLLQATIQPTGTTCSQSDSSGCTLSDVQDPQKQAYAQANTHLRVGTEANISNTQLRLAPNSPNDAALQSYHLDLNAQRWRNEGQLRLAKGHDDITRLRNKLIFDLLRDVPHIPSLRTQFVRLQSDGQTRGVYTHVEALDERYLHRRGWLAGGRLYEAENFSFFANTGNLDLNAEHEPSNPTAFGSQLRIHHGSDHRPLLAMLEAVNDYARPFDEVLDQYFSRNNLINWLAFNLVVYNDDSLSHKFFLYNPAEEQRFYLGLTDPSEAIGSPVPFTYNSTEREDLTRRRRWGLANWGSLPLFNRLLREPGVFDDIKRAVTEIRERYVTDAQIQTLTRAYEDTISTVVAQSPDKENLKVDAEDINFGRASQFSTPDQRLQLRSQRINNIPSRIAGNVDRFLNQLRPLIPFEIKSPFTEDGQYVFWWRPASDPNAGNVSYDIIIADNAALENPVYTRQNLSDADTDTPRIEHFIPITTLPNGTYYYRVIARTDANSDAWQVPLNDASGLIGVRQITLSAN